MKPNDYRVAASCFEPNADHAMPQRLDALRSHLSELLATTKPDLVVLPEIVLACGLSAEQRWGAEPLSGPTVSLVAELAASASTNICAPIIEDDDGTLYNTAVYVDRQGKIAGTYRKIVPTCGEIQERDIRPGSMDQPPVVLDGLRLGTAICFDENFPDLIWHWIDEGVDLLIFPSYTFAGELMRSWARNCGVPLVCSFPWESIIYDRDGDILAKAGDLTTTVRFGNHPRWIASTLNLRRRIYHIDFNQVHLPELTARHGAKIDVQLLVRDGRIVITALSDEPSLDDLEREFGLTPVQDYLRHSRRLAQP